MSDKSSPPTLKWKGEIEFEGSLELFKSFLDALGAHPVAVSVPTALAHGAYAGYISPVLLQLLEKERIQSKLVEGVAPRFAFPVVKGIAGGIRTPHLHLGDQVVLVERERFKTVLGELARDVFEQRVAGKEDYYDIVAPLAANA